MGKEVISTIFIGSKGFKISHSFQIALTKKSISNLKGRNLKIYKFVEEG